MALPVLKREREREALSVLKRERERESERESERERERESEREFSDSIRHVAVDVSYVSSSE
jgi:hypothetical protein